MHVHLWCLLTSLSSMSVQQLYKLNNYLSYFACVMQVLIQICKAFELSRVMICLFQRKHMLNYR